MTNVPKGKDCAVHSISVYQQVLSSIPFLETKFSKRSSFHFRLLTYCLATFRSLEFRTPLESQSSPRVHFAETTISFSSCCSWVPEIHSQFLIKASRGFSSIFFKVSQVWRLLLKLHAERLAETCQWDIRRLPVRHSVRRCRTSSRSVILSSANFLVFGINSYTHRAQRICCDISLQIINVE